MPRAFLVKKTPPRTVAGVRTPPTYLHGDGEKWGQLESPVSRLTIGDELLIGGKHPQQQLMGHRETKDQFDAISKVSGN